MVLKYLLSGANIVLSSRCNFYITVTFKYLNLKIVFMNLFMKTHYLEYNREKKVLRHIICTAFLFECFSYIHAQYFPLPYSFNKLKTLPEWSRDQEIYTDLCLRLCVHFSCESLCKSSRSVTSSCGPISMAFFSALLRTTRSFWKWSDSNDKVPQIDACWALSGLFPERSENEVILPGLQFWFYTQCIVCESATAYICNKD